MHHSNFLTSFKYAFAGLWYVFRTQRNARIHLLVATIIVAVGLWLGLNRTEWAIIALTIGMVLAPEAGAVVLMVIAAVVVGALILGPPLWRVLFALF
jgi:diacylglycerol kinase (ATP)